MCGAIHLNSVPLVETYHRRSMLQQRSCNLGLQSGVLHRNYFSLGERDQHSACAMTAQVGFSWPCLRLLRSLSSWVSMIHRHHPLSGIEISMEVLRFGPDVEPLPHEGLGPRKLALLGTLFPHCLIAPRRGGAGSKRDLSTPPPPRSRSPREETSNPGPKSSPKGRFHAEQGSSNL